jgi:uncharacterized protein YggE
MCEENMSCKHGGGCHCGGGKGYLKKAGVAALSLLTLFLLAKTVTEVKGFAYVGNDKPAQSTINVSGKGEVVAMPDIATFSFGVTEESLDITEAQSRAAKKSNDVLDFLSKNGVDKKDVKTAGYNAYPRYEYPTTYYGQTGKRILAGYVVTQNFEVKVRKLENAGKLIGGVAEFGVSDVGSLAFSFDKEEQYLKDAREKAIDEAKKKAKELARDLDVDLVRIVSFSENGSYPPIYYAKEMAMNQAADARGVSPELPSGETKIVSNVSITYEIR